MSRTDKLEGRLHPFTPLSKSWGIASALFFLVYRDLKDFVVETDPVVVAVVFAGTLALLCVPVFLSWWRSRFCLDNTALEYRFGLMWRTHQRYELHHIQTVDISRPLIGRILGVCSLKIALAASSVTLSYLSVRQARRIRDRILNEEPEGDLMFRVDTRTLAVSLITDLRLMIKVIGGAAIGILPYALSGHLLALLTAFPVLRGLWRMTGSAMARQHGWSVYRTEDGNYRTRTGLFDTVEYTWQSDRLQSVEIQQPVLWRRWDWVRLGVNAAGHREGALLLPVCPRSLAEKLTAHMLGMEATYLLDRPVSAPPRARWATPFHKALGHRVGGGFFAVWSGMFLKQRIEVCPVRLTQDIHLMQGMWQKRLGLASVGVQLEGGPDLVAEHIDPKTAAELAARLRWNHEEGGT